MDLGWEGSGGQGRSQQATADTSQGGVGVGGRVCDANDKSISPMQMWEPVGQQLLEREAVHGRLQQRPGSLAERGGPTWDGSSIPPRPPHPAE